MGAPQAGSAHAYLCRRCKAAGKLVHAVTRRMTDKNRPSYREPLCEKHAKEVAKQNGT